jgi:hypothetical protein
MSFDNKLKRTTLNLNLTVNINRKFLTLVIKIRT